MGALLLEGQLYHELSGRLTSDMFYDERHGVIFGAIEYLAAHGQPVDLYTVGRRLEESQMLEKVGGAACLAQLTQRVGTGIHTLFHAQILRQLWVMRTMAATLSTLAGKCYEGDFDAIMAEYTSVTRHLDSLFAGAGAEKHIREILQRHGKVIDERIARANRGELLGLSYGLTDLDRLTNGMCPGQLIILAARPAMGKTALALKFSKSAALAGAHVTVTSLEMSDISLTDRLVCTYAGVDSSRLKSGRMRPGDLQAYQQAVGELERLEISIYDSPGATLTRLSSMARARRRKGKLDLLVIDYLQLIETEAGATGYRNNREREVAEISRGLKRLALELEIPVLLLCQLNRAAESRADKQPQLYDLRESGGIEQDADLVIMPFRPSYYKDTEFCDDNGAPIPSDMGLLFIRKQRDGATGQVSFRYSPDLSTIEDYLPAFSDSTPTNALPF